MNSHAVFCVIIHYSRIGIYEDLRILHSPKASFSRHAVRAYQIYGYTELVPALNNSKRRGHVVVNFSICDGDGQKHGCTHLARVSSVENHY